MPPPAYRTPQRPPMDYNIADPNAPPSAGQTSTATPVPAQSFSGVGGPAAGTGNPLADAALGQGGGLGVTVTPGEKNVFGTRGESTIGFSGEPTLPNLDFRAVEGGIGDVDLRQGAAMAARMYRNPYADLADPGGRYNPIIDRGVGARGIVGEAMAAQREGREVDPIMGRTARYAGDPTAPVDMRPLARNETEAAFWDNWERINQKWLAGGYQKVGPGSGSELQQGKVDPGLQMPPRGERRGQTGTGRGDDQEFVTGYADDELPEDVLWEEAYAATGGKNNDRLTDWLIENKGMSPLEAVNVAYMREYEQLESAKYKISKTPLTYGWTKIAGGERWEPQRPLTTSANDWQALLKLDEQQKQVLQAFYKKSGEVGAKTASIGLGGKKAEDIDFGAWRKNLDRYL